MHSAELRLGLRNLYILPTRLGWLWLAAALLLQLLAMQSQRNGPLLLSWLLLALWLLTLLLCHRNLEGLVLHWGGGSGFAQEWQDLALRSHSAVARQGVRLGLAGPPRRRLPLPPPAIGAAQPRDLPAGDGLLQVAWRPEQRGWQRPGRLWLASTAPLGLFCCWTFWQPEPPLLVYPARRPGPVAWATPAGATPVDAGLAGSPLEGADHWHDLRPHRPEHGPTRLAWKVLAQGRGRFSKHLLASTADPVLLAPAPGLPPEQALQHLCHQVCSCAQRSRCYGLQLPGLQIPPGQGRRHRDRCLAALANQP